MNTQPWLAEALASAQAPEYPHESAELADLQVGDLWVVGASEADDDLRRVVLIVGTEGVSVRVMLVSSDIDYATDVDVLLPRETTGAPYELMVETALHGLIRWNQVVKRIGVVPDDLVDAVLDFVWEQRPSLLENIRGAGTPSDLSPARLTFEVEELAEFRRLLGDSKSRGLDSTVPLVDVGLITSDVLSGECGWSLAMALRDPHVRFCAGLASLNACRGADIGRLIGPDILHWRLVELAETQLLTDDAQRFRFKGVDGVDTETVLAAFDSDDAVCLRLIGSSSVEPSEPIGFLGRLPVVSGERST